MSPWESWLNAEVYDRFVRERTIYQALNRQLVTLAQLAAARRVLDLACGTGATALAALAVLPADAMLLGVDASEAVVGLARAHVRDPRARFKVAAAAALTDTLGGAFDRALCNAAFWQFPAVGPVLAELAALLVPGARFVFNVPAERVVGEPAPVHPFQAALARTLEARAGNPFPKSAVMIDPQALSRDLSRAGFTLAEQVRFTYRGTQGELMELMEIPAMIEPLAPTLAAADRDAALAEARRRADPTEAVEVPWIYFIARRNAS